MTKLIISDFPQPEPSKLKAERVKRADGKVTTVYAVDVDSAQVGIDVLTVFKRNAARARRTYRSAVKKLGVAAE